MTLMDVTLFADNSI